MAYPAYFPSDYINASGNIEASGYYKHYLTQKLANMYPVWDHIRDNPNSVGQQYLSASSKTLGDINQKLSETLDERFISLAPVDEIDVLSRMKIPSTIPFLENQYIECWTAPSGATPSGYPFPEDPTADPDTVNSFQLSEISDLEEFYYFAIPTRIKAYNVEPYSDERAISAGIEFPVKSSGIYDSETKHIDIWKREHDVRWAHAEGLSSEFLKQDSLTMETYESYAAGASGYPKGFTFYRGKLYWIGNVPSSSGYFLNISNPHPSPVGEYLDTLGVYDISDLAPDGSAPPSGIAFDEEGHIWILDEDRTSLYALDAMHDYFLVDKENRYIYFREDYSDPGVFVKPA